MARLVIVNPPHEKGRMVRLADGTRRRRCRVCGGVVYGRNGGVCRACLAAGKAGKGANDGR